MSTALASAGAGEGSGAASGGAGNAAAGGSGDGQGTSGGQGSGASGGSGTGAAGGSAASWRDSLPADIKSDPAILSFQDVASLTKSFIHAQSVIGRKGAIPPADWTKATDAEKRGFFDAVGVPAADKYTVTAPKDAKIPDEFINSFKAESQKLGVLPFQADGYLAWFAKTDLERSNASQKAETARITKELDGLKGEWGENYARNLQSIMFAAKEKGSQEFVQMLMKDPKLGSNVHFLKWASEMTKLMGEDRLREGGVGSGQPSRAEIEAELNSLRMSGALAASNPNRAVSMQRFESLSKMLTGGR